MSSDFKNDAEFVDFFIFIEKIFKFRHICNFYIVDYGEYNPNDFEDIEIPFTCENFKLHLDKFKDKNVVVLKSDRNFLTELRTWQPGDHTYSLATQRVLPPYNNIRDLQRSMIYLTYNTSRNLSEVKSFDIFKEIFQLHMKRKMA